VLGITRSGVEKIKEGVLMRLPFEQTAKYLFDAALHGHVNIISGVGKSVVMSRPIACAGPVRARATTSHDNLSSCLAYYM